MSDRQRILILYASGGLGHVKAAEAIVSAFAQHAPMLAVDARNVLDFARPLFRHAYEDGYNFISAHTIKLWGWLYQRYSDPRRHGVLDRLARWGVEPKLLAFLHQYRPTYVIGTHPMPVRVLANAQRDGRWLQPVPLASVVTDFGCHRYWVEPAVDQYFVATPDVAACLAGFGLPLDHLVASGIPINPKFRHVADTAALRLQLGCQPATPTVLVVGGLFSLPYLERLQRELQRRCPIQLLVVAGRDRRLQRQLQHSQLPHHKAVRTFGFIDNLHELIAAADLVLTKAGGLTVSECLAVGTPLAVSRIIAGQEEDNLRYLLDHGLAIHASTAEAMAAAMVKLLSDAPQLARMKGRCLEFGQPDAAARLVAAVMRRLR